MSQCSLLQVSEAVAPVAPQSPSTATTICVSLGGAAGLLAISQSQGFSLGCPMAVTRKENSLPSPGHASTDQYEGSDGPP